MGDTMKEIAYVVAVVVLAMFLSSTLASFSSIHRAIKATELTIERMKANPSPEYEHYPQFDD